MIIRKLTDGPAGARRVMAESRVLGPARSRPGWPAAGAAAPTRSLGGCPDLPSRRGGLAGAPGQPGDARDAGSPRRSPAVQPFACLMGLAINPAGAHPRSRPQKSPAMSSSGLPGATMSARRPAGHAEVVAAQLSAATEVAALAPELAKRPAATSGSNPGRRGWTGTSRSPSRKRPCVAGRDHLWESMIQSCRVRISRWPRPAASLRGTREVFLGHLHGRDDVDPARVAASTPSSWIR